MPDSENESLDADENGIVDEDENENDFEEDGSEELDSDDEEFSLDQLSAAYAQVLKEQNQLGQTVSDQPDPEVGVNQNLATEGARPQSPDRQSGEDAIRSELDRASAPVKTESDDDNAACPISPKSILEAILFVGGPKDVKLTSRKIAAVMRDVSPKEITSMVKQLNQTYIKEHRAYRIVTNKGAIRMELHPDMIPVQNHLLGRNRMTRLTQQAIDVLAIVAYNQPIQRDQVDKIRAKPSSSILNQMVRRDLLQLEVTDKPNRKIYRTTDRFLDLFGLDSVEDLPQSHDVSDIEELAD